MATFKPVILKGAIHINKKGESNIKILVTHKEKNEYIKTDQYVPCILKDGKTISLMGDDGKVKKEHPNARYINTKLKDITLSYERALLKFDDKYLNRLTVQQIKKILIGEDVAEIDFWSYAKKRIQELRNDGRTGTANSYEDSVERFKDFVKTSWLPFSSIDKKLLEAFVTHKKNEGKSINSIGVYLRSIRALFNDAIEDLNKDGQDSLINNYPFRKFKIESGATRDRNIELELLQKIMNVELTGMQEIARDICMLIFYFIGVNVKDLFYNKGLENDRFIYTRYKGKKKYSIKVEPEAQAILDKYKGEKYVLCFADNCAEVREGNWKPHQRKLYQYIDHRAFNKMLNENLKDIASNDNVKADASLSTYFFRYAWGNIARDICKISMDDISAAYGHQKQSLKITGVYVRENLKIIDESNRKVLDVLKIV